jgi:hypothetical protein
MQDLSRGDAIPKMDTPEETREVVGALAGDVLGGGDATERARAAGVLHTVFENIAAHPDAAKYRHLRKGNAAIAGVLAVPGAYEVLTAGGFRDLGDALEMPPSVGGATAGAASGALEPYMAAAGVYVAAAAHPAGGHAAGAPAVAAFGGAGGAHGAGAFHEDAEYAARRAAAAAHAAEIEARRVAERAEHDRLLRGVHEDRREVAADHRLHPTETEHARETHFGATEVRIKAADPPS